MSIEQTGGGFPDEIFHKDAFRVRFGVGQKRALTVQTYIIDKGLDHANAGKSIIAPLSVWYQALKDAPVGYGCGRKARR
jgi:hypothetical protein